MLNAQNISRSVIEPASQPVSSFGATTQPVGPVYAAPTGTVSGRTSDTSSPSPMLYRLSPSDSTRNPIETISTPFTLPGGTPTVQPQQTTPQQSPQQSPPGTEPIDFSSITDPFGGNVSAPTAGDTAQTSMLSNVLASLSGLLGSSASGGTGAASPDAVTAVPVSAPSTSSNGSAMKNILILAVIVGAGYYAYKKGWLSKIGLSPNA